MASGEQVCFNCGATKSPLWRRGANCELLCNACGLYLRNHGSRRPKRLPSKVELAKILPKPKKTYLPVKTSQINTIQVPFGFATPILLTYNGKKFHINDFVSVRGSSRTFYGIVTALLVSEFGEKKLQIKWLIPKPGMLRNICNPPNFEDFVLGPYHDAPISLDCVIEVYPFLNKAGRVNLELPSEFEAAMLLQLLH